jgi:hypothetical protein
MARFHRRLKKAAADAVKKQTNKKPLKLLVTLAVFNFFLARVIIYQLLEKTIV